MKIEFGQIKISLEFGQMQLLEASSYHHSPRSKLVFGQMKIIEARFYYRNLLSKSDLEK